MSKIEVDAIDKQSGSTLTLGGSGTAVTLACGATQSGFGRTGTVDWQTTPKTATFTAVSGEGYFANTTGSAFNMNLPAGTAGAIVSVADYAATWDTTNLTVVPNGTDKIGGTNADVVLDTKGQSVTFIFVDSTQGWINTMDSTSNVRASEFIQATGGTITCSGNCRIHTFTGPGTFTVCATAVCAANNIVSHLIVAGGGAGGNSIPGNNAAGGGGGGFREVKNPVTPYTASPLDGYSTPANRVTVTAQGYPIVVGGGGPSPSSEADKGVNGSNSSFGGITAAGGGGAGSNANRPGSPGGSGGGGSGGAFCQAGGTGNTPPVSPAQGKDGGNSSPSGAPPDGGAGGGGGATEAGITGADVTSGRGGVGATTSINGSPTAFSGGGGGGAACGGGAASPCGTGGAGSSGTAATAGTTNRGGGGGGTRLDPDGGANGGSGIVIIRYKYQ